jgi:hypothetical protein
MEKYFMYKQITREMIEKYLDDELNLIYENQVKKEITSIGTIWIAPADIIKNKNQQKYEEFLKDFCNRKNILIQTDNDGNLIYLEKIEE